MRVKTSPRKFLTIFSISVVLFPLTVVLGAPLMRVLRMTYGALAYWLLGVAVVALFTLMEAPAVSVFVGSIWMTLGAYMEMERRGLRWSVSGILSILAGCLFFAGSTVVALRMQGIHHLAEAKTLVTQFADKIYQANPELRVDAGLLVQYIPSSVIIILLVTLGLGLIFERRAFSWVKLPREQVASQLKLLEFRLPDFMIWVAGTAFLLTMENFHVKALEILGWNAVYIVTVLYFFQGLAVLEVFLKSIKASTMMRIAIYIIVIGQLPFITAVGLIDYWADFRRRLRKWALKSPEKT